MAEKVLRWVGSSLDELRAFPAEARRDAGYQLFRVQQGLTPSDWKPMASVGRGVYEIRLRSKQEHRVFYVAKFKDSVYVLHAFEKKSQKTRQADIEIGRQRLAVVQKAEGR